MKKTIFTIAIGLFGLIANGQSKLDIARMEYNNLRVVEAKEIFEQIWKTPASQNEKIDAGRQLVHIYWKFYKDYNTAKKYSDSLQILSKDDFDIMFQMADISIQAEKYEIAEKYLEKAISSASKDYQLKRSKIKFAEYVMNKSQKDLLEQKAVNINDVNKAYGFIREYYLNEPENLSLTRLYLGIALLSDNDSEI